jgi:hypothetical protein
MTRRDYLYHHPKHGPLRVMSGWDRQRQGFFLTVEQLEGLPPFSEEAYYLFSNLDPETFPAGMDFPKTMIPLEGVIKLLEHHHIPTPADFLDDLEIDQRFDAGPLQQKYALEVFL